ncbi:hypothetical protein BTGOE5_53710 [Bacillus thuringiensis]|nr:hypothetical protein BTGOE5_53710 [Bacillus thuringiensis]OFD01769.1 hypothetical protein BTGOE7_55380 [Bacillus thuringiensis]
MRGFLIPADYYPLPIGLLQAVYPTPIFFVLLRIWRWEYYCSLIHSKKEALKYLLPKHSGNDLFGESSYQAISISLGVDS